MKEVCLEWVEGGLDLGALLYPESKLIPEVSCHFFKPVYHLSCGQVLIPENSVLRGLKLIVENW